ncbi:unnamed protein product [Urochloa humidicola]
MASTADNKNSIKDPCTWEVRTTSHLPPWWTLVRLDCCWRLQYKRSLHLGGADNITPATVVDLSEIGLLLVPTRAWMLGFLIVVDQFKLWTAYLFLLWHVHSTRSYGAHYANGHDGTRWSAL